MSTAITISAPISRAVLTGIGLTSPPSTYFCLPMVAGTNTLGILHDARTACPALPLIKSAFVHYQDGCYRCKTNWEFLNRLVTYVTVNIVL